MDKIILLFLLIFVILVFILSYKNEKLKQIKEDMESVIKANNNLHEEIKKLNAVDKIKADNRKDTNEKINNMHIGNTVDNAFNILCDNENK